MPLSSDTPIIRARLGEQAKRLGCLPGDGTPDFSRQESYPLEHKQATRSAADLRPMDPIEGVLADAMVDAGDASSVIAGGPTSDRPVSWGIRLGSNEAQRHAFARPDRQLLPSKCLAA